MFINQSVGINGYFGFVSGRCYH